MSPWRRIPGPDNIPPSTLSRRTERVLLSTQLTATIRAGEREKRIRTRALDISETGIGAVCVEGWSAGAPVDLDLTLPQQSAHLEIQAIVRHQTGVRCGLEFVDVSPRQRQTLLDVCRFLSGRSTGRST
jgi:c-di-GMP-binding flagellar brake protein YcgR